ncbi:MAG: flagellar biosynthesis protein FlhF [Defluviitaleaceae bacterium]|nr:flagellar biosynthesis protein FlhF [Defluviitaleaceae bacterium]
MKIKKFEGKSEHEIMQRVKDELGVSAIILSIKRKPYKGIMAFFRAPLVVITAAYEEKSSAERIWEEAAGLRQSASYLFEREEKRERDESDPAIKKGAEIKAPSPVLLNPAASQAAPVSRPAASFVSEIKLSDQQQRIASLENKLTMTEELLEKVVAQLNVAEQMAKSPEARKYDNSLIQIFYESLVEQGVMPEIAEKVLEDVDSIDEREKIDITLIVKIVYNTILNILGEPDAIEDEAGDGGTRTVAFMGPTGVGKTTTIAKLSSILTLNHNKRVGLITADTYRIAAVEQLKTYAEILGLDVKVVYDNKEVQGSVGSLEGDNDVILIDTAGRSHRNDGNLTELKELLEMIPDSRRCLVLSVATKCEDLLNIIKTYSAVTEFDLIFTKLDETGTLGSILNICHITGCKASYVTFGQNVPDDIEIVKPDKLAKALLGLGTGQGHPFLRKGSGL